jgi:hypothetical protein
MDHSRRIRQGDTVEVTSYGKTIRGTVTMIGHCTNRPTQMRRHDTGQLRAIIGTCRKVDQSAGVCDIHGDFTKTEHESCPECNPLVQPDPENPIYPH